MNPRPTATVFRVAARTCVALLFASAALLAFGGCSANDQTTIQQASSFDQGIAPAVIHQSTNSDYLQKIGDRIIAAAKVYDAQHVGPGSHFSADTAWMYQDIHWQLVNSPTINAFTTGGHYVYIYNALFQLCKNEDELAAVMSHEYAHIYCRHVQKGSGRQEALGALSLAAEGAGYVAGGQANGSSYASSAGSLAQEGGNFIGMGFTRGDEAQADEFGFAFYCRAGYPPEHFGDFFREMIAAGYDTSSDLTSDHPTLASRAKAADERAAKLGPAFAQYRQPEIATGQTFEQYKQSALTASQGMPSDKQALGAKNLLQAMPRSCWIPTEQQDQLDAQQKIIDDAQKAQGQQPNQ
jgi:predicted Zn-dependent protease